MATGARVLAATAAALLIMILFDTGSPADDGPVAPGKRAPDFALTDLSGRSVRLSDFTGKVVLLDFWATWCAPCRREVPDFIQMQRKYIGSGFTVLAVALDEEGAAVVKPFARQMRINYPVLIGSAGVAAAYGGIQALPIALLIGKDRTVMQAFLGATDRSRFEDAIQSALHQANR